jgi:hypothetical protein
VVALGIGIDGTAPLGVVEGDTENATVVKTSSLISATGAWM